MPWCDDCARFYNPNTLDADGNCPDGHTVADPDAEAEQVKAPWHFWLLVIAIAVYLGWRAIEGLIWLGSQLF